MSDAIPCGWQRRSLSALGEYENGFAFNDRHWSELGLPIVRIAQITGSQGIVDRYPGRLSDTFRIDTGDLIFSWSGTLAVVRWTGGPAWLNQHLFKVVPHAGIDESLLFHLLQASVAEMSKRTHGSTMKHIKRGELREFFVTLPIERNEQHKLAQVLDTLDTAIHQTEAIIAKLKAVKQGLLHDLLTRGIDANGELRPPQAEAPQLYKPSPLGWIPKEWDAGTIGSYLDGEQGIKPGPFGSSIKKESYSESGFKVYGQEQVIAGDQEIGNYFVPLRKFQELQDFAVEVGDVLISLVGTIGKVLVLKTPLAPGLINPRLMRLRSDLRIAQPEFTGFLISSDSFVRQVIANAGGGTMPVINKRIIAGIRVPVVPLKEQQEILKRRNAADQRISWESAALEKLKAQKAGLMDDLLTGRIRVTPLLEATT
jgi:type I restriction enzyme S subunit